MAKGWTGIAPYGERYLFACPEGNCYWRLTVSTLEQAQEQERNHNCPHWGGKTKVSWSVTKTLVEQMWEKLDIDMDAIKSFDGKTLDHESERERDLNKARARAIAECLAIFMKPFFETADDIVREAMRRHAARVAGDAEYATAGIGARRYESAAMAHASAAGGWYDTPGGGYTSDPSRAGEKPRARQSTSRPVAITLDAKTQESIRNGHKAMPTVFTAEVLAKQYGVSVKMIEAVLSA